MVAVPVEARPQVGSVQPALRGVSRQERPFVAVPVAELWEARAPGAVIECVRGPGADRRRTGVVDPPRGCAAHKIADLRGRRALTAVEEGNAGGRHARDFGEIATHEESTVSCGDVPHAPERVHCGREVLLKGPGLSVGGQQSQIPVLFKPLVETEVEVALIELHSLHVAFRPLAPESLSGTRVVGGSLIPGADVRHVQLGTVGCHIQVEGLVVVIHVKGE